MLLVKVKISDSRICSGCKEWKKWEEPSLPGCSWVRKNMISQCPNCLDKKNNDMTAAEAINLLKIQWEHLFALDQDEIDGLIKLIQKQATEIERLNNKCDNLKCCANCNHHRVVINEIKCFEGLPEDEWRFSERAKHVDGDSNCDKWQMEKKVE